MVLVSCFLFTYVLKIGEGAGQIPRHQIEALLSAIPAGAHAIVQSAVPSL